MSNKLTRKNKKNIFYAPFSFLKLDFSHFNSPHGKAAFNVKMVLKRFQENETIDFFFYFTKMMKMRQEYLKVRQEIVTYLVLSANIFMRTANYQAAKKPFLK